VRRFERQGPVSSILRRSAPKSRATSRRFARFPGDQSTGVSAVDAAQAGFRQHTNRSGPIFIVLAVFFPEPGIPFAEILPGPDFPHAPSIVINIL
jgi:hypothetical protein